jgi:hypothetical protein
MAETQITTRQIKDGAITNAKVAAGAAIATTKLADGADFVKRTGTVAMTGSLNMGSQTITNLATPSSGTDGVNRNYVDTAIAALNSVFDSKPSVRAASTANVTLATPGASIDGVSLTSGDRILLKNQSAPAENGIYIWTGAAALLTRALDMDAWNEVPGAWVTVEEGTTLADTFWLSTANAGGTLNTTAITWTQFNTGAGLSTSNFVDSEVPSGTVNGVNVTFTLANTPTAGTVHLYANGLRMKAGASEDYTISGATITMTTAPETGDVILADYRK